MNVCKSRLKGYRLFAVDEFIWLFVEQTMCGGSVLGGGGLSAYHHQSRPHDPCIN